MRPRDFDGLQSTSSYSSNYNRSQPQTQPSTSLPYDNQHHFDEDGEEGEVKEDYSIPYHDNKKYYHHNHKQPNYYMNSISNRSRSPSPTHSSYRSLKPRRSYSPIPRQNSMSPAISRANSPKISPRTPEVHYEEASTTNRNTNTTTRWQTKTTVTNTRITKEYSYADDQPSQPSTNQQPNQQQQQSNQTLNQPINQSQTLSQHQSQPQLQSTGYQDHYSQHATRQNYHNNQSQHVKPYSNPQQQFSQNQVPTYSQYPQYNFNLQKPVPPPLQINPSHHQSPQSSPIWKQRSSFGFKQRNSSSLTPTSNNNTPPPLTPKPRVTNIRASIVPEIDSEVSTLFLNK